MDILLIENEEVLAKILKRKLSKKGYQLKVVNNSERGLEVIEDNKPDLVLLDVEMSIGFEVLKKMKKDSELKKIPVIIISNSGEPDQLKKAQELGAVDWIIKTEFDPQKAVNKVEQKINS